MKAIILLSSLVLNIQNNNLMLSLLTLPKFTGFKLYKGFLCMQQVQVREGVFFSLIFPLSPFYIPLSEKRLDEARIYILRPELAYKSLVRQQVEYASTVCSPFTKHNVQNVELW